MSESMSLLAASRTETLVKTATAYFWLSSPFVETTIDDRECDSKWFFEQDDKEHKRNRWRGGANLRLAVSRTAWRVIFASSNCQIIGGGTI